MFLFHWRTLYIRFFLCFGLCGSDVLANFTPPPPPIISKYNISNYDVGEPSWPNGGDVDISRAHYLTADRNLNSLTIYDGGGLYLYDYSAPHNPHNLTIGAGGIKIYGSGNGILGKGTITSSQPFLNIQLNRVGDFHINSVIKNNGKQKVGLRISGVGTVCSTLVLGGGDANTFTGGVDVSGRTILALSKHGRRSQIHGNLLIRDGGILELRNSGQLSKQSTVTLRNGTLRAKGSLGLGTERFHKLAIEEDSRLQFESGNNSRLYLDELAIFDRSLLEVQGWEEGRHWLLVRKTSPHLDDALRKIRFQGYDPNDIHLEEFNKEYWSISGAPEPSTYGAIFASGVLGLALWEKKRRGHKNHPGMLDYVLT